MNSVGFMQGRLSDVIDGVIQEFPRESWEDEFQIADEIDIHTMEWTLDQKDLQRNPLLTEDGRKRILHLCDKHALFIPSLTGDCFMQFPFWKAEGALQAELVADFVAIIKACGILEIGIIVIPLVDNGRLDTLEQEDVLVSILDKHTSVLRESGVRVAFESDFSPQELRRFIDRLDPGSFGINYDIGNSAALGFIPKQEFFYYGDRIINVHVKDRPLGSTTVPLGDGDADFESVFDHLAKSNYTGNYILQTARDSAGRHAQVISKYLAQTKLWIAKYES